MVPTLCPSAPSDARGSTGHFKVPGRSTVSPVPSPSSRGFTVLSSDVLHPVLLRDIFMKRFQLLLRRNAVTHADPGTQAACSLVHGPSAQPAARPSRQGQRSFRGKVIIVLLIDGRCFSKQLLC